MSDDKPTLPPGAPDYEANQRTLEQERVRLEDEIELARLRALDPNTLATLDTVREARELGEALKNPDGHARIKDAADMVYGSELPSGIDHGGTSALLQGLEREPAPFNPVHPDAPEPTGVGWSVPVPPEHRETVFPMPPSVIPTQPSPRNAATLAPSDIPTDRPEGNLRYLTLPESEQPEKRDTPEPPSSDNKHQNIHDTDLDLSVHVHAALAEEEPNTTITDLDGNPLRDSSVPPPRSTPVPPSSGRGWRR